ncbi:DUF4267 domain-containing protein [Chitinophaga pinensis]|uniref:DUF4267 domain-containing protein n=1 Tax=Chitinophaga pinensis TaxID=79329 RepID=A0A5C6LPQ0_9BACT|nr:DUF4267 domain-containing protein [Chitinophaga pinensis]TWV99112.1 DUF4267 domain-containing protein [Chitinophaga pinensis]
MQTTIKHIAGWLAALTGIGIIFIGARFFFMPETAEHAFGIHVTADNHAFHYIKGIRDIFSGIIVLLLLLTKEYRALGLMMLAVMIIPATDFLIVWQQPDYEVARLIPHLIAVIIAIVLGVYYFFNAPKRNRHVI